MTQRLVENLQLIRQTTRIKSTLLQHHERYKLALESTINLNWLIFQFVRISLCVFTFFSHRMHVCMFLFSLFLSLIGAKQGCENMFLVGSQLSAGLILKLRFQLIDASDKTAPDSNRNTLLMKCQWRFKRCWHSFQYCVMANHVPAPEADDFADKKLNNLICPSKHSPPLGIFSARSNIVYD